MASSVTHRSYVMLCMMCCSLQWGWSMRVDALGYHEHTLHDALDLHSTVPRRHGWVRRS